MNLCIGSLTYLCIISCVIALPLTLGQDISTDKNNKAIGDTTVRETNTVSSTLSADNPTTTAPDTTPTTAKTTTVPTTTPAPESTTTAKSTSTSTVKPSTTKEPPITTSTTPQPPQPCRRFDGPSFIGGTILSMGLLAIFFICYKFYKARNERNYHTL